MPQRVEKALKNLPGGIPVLFLGKFFFMGMSDGVEGRRGSARSRCGAIFREEVEIGCTPSQVVCGGGGLVK